jgi:hypothetical protein
MECGMIPFFILDFLENGINGWEVRVLRAVSKMENFGVREVIPPRFPIFERTSSPPSENPEGSRPFGYRGFPKEPCLDSVVVES